MLKPDSALQVRQDDVAARVIDGEAIIMNLANGMYYSMDKVGAEIWLLIEEGRRLRDITTAISHRYETPNGVVQADVERLAGELLAENLVAVAVEDGPPASLEALPDRVQQPYETPVLQAYRDMADLLALDPPMPGLRATPWQAPST